MAATSLSDEEEYVFNDKNDEICIYTESDVEKMVEEDIKSIAEYVKKNAEKDYPDPDFLTYYVPTNIPRDNGTMAEVSSAVLVDRHYSCMHTLKTFRIIFRHYRGTTFYLQLRSINKEAVIIPDFINGFERIQMIVDGFGDSIDKKLFSVFKTNNEHFMKRAFIVSNPERAMEIINESIDQSIQSLTSSLSSFFTMCPDVKKEALTSVFSGISRMKRELDKKEDMPGPGKRLRPD